MKENVQYKILTIVFVVASISLACNFQGLGRQAQKEVIPVSTDAVDDLQEEINEALGQVASGSDDITLMIDEVELTSLATFELQKIQEPQILEPQVYLRDEQIQMFANLKQGNLLSPITLVMTVAADVDGYPQYQIISATLGPLAVPDAILGQIKSMIDNALSEKIRSQSNQFFIRSIAIADGVMIIRGQSR